MWGVPKEDSSVIRVLLLCVSPFCSNLNHPLAVTNQVERRLSRLSCAGEPPGRGKANGRVHPGGCKRSLRMGHWAPRLLRVCMDQEQTLRAAPSQPQGNKSQQRAGDFFRNINFMAWSSLPPSLLLASFSVENRQKKFVSVVSSLSIPSCASLRQPLSWYERMLGSILFRAEQIIPLRIFSDTSTAQQNMAPESRWKQTAMKPLQDTGKPKLTQHQFFCLRGWGCCRFCNCCHIRLCSYDTSRLRAIDGGLSQ